MATNQPSKFRGMPQTPLGKWAVGLAALFGLMFISNLNEIIQFPGMLTMVLGIVAGILTLAAIIWKRERSWLVWLMLLPGVFAIVLTSGAILFPH